MAIVRILANSKSFLALDYNEKRVENGEAEILASENFKNTILGNKEELKIWSKGSRIKNSQFHVTISVPKQSLSFDQLKVIGQLWLNKMGYGKNPYIIYGHHNTKNNHIHIVTSRVGPDKKKVNDSFEHIRAMKALDEVLGIDRKKYHRSTVAKLLRWSYENQAQLCSIIEANGFKVKNDKQNNGIHIFKEHLEIGFLSGKLIDWSCKRTKKISLDEQQKKRIRAWLIKYGNTANNFDELNSMLKNKLGVKLALYGNKDSYFGYNIINYKNKAIFRGGQVMSIIFLSELIQKEKKEINASLILEDLLRDNRLITSKDINQRLKVYGLKLQDDLIIDKTTGVVLKEIEKEYYEQIKYNDKFTYCMNKFHPVSLSEREWIAKMYSIKLEDMNSFIEKNNHERTEEIDYYGSILKAASRDGTLKEYLKENEIRFYPNESDILFVDMKNGKIFSSDSIGLNTVDLTKDIPLGKGDVAEIEEETNIGYLFENAIQSLYPVTQGVGGTGTGGRSKKKRNA